MRKGTKYTAISMLGIMFILLFCSAWNDSGTMDELAHIPSGYSYLTERDFRLNPEHPPLIKDLSALPLMFLNLNFPADASAWKDDINGQWDMGRIFIYESGNDADKIFRFSRLPIMLLAMLFGWLFFKWARGLHEDKAALLALFFFAFSPTFLAHSRYVTTDLAAAFGFFIGIASFLNFLSKRNKKSLLIAGIAFGIAQLLKFSLMLLAPIYIILGLLWVFLKNYEDFKFKKFIKEEFLMLWKILLIGLIGMALVWFIYLFHIWQYPVERQINDTTFTLASFNARPLADLTIWLSGIPILRGFGQYLLGLLMVLQRAAGGNTTYFMGEITNAGWPHYFPVLYLLKEHLALHILTLVGLIFGLRNIIKSREKNLRSVFAWLKENFVFTASFIFLAIYWVQAISSPLNIGVRHVLPTFPFIYLLVSRQTIRWTLGRLKKGLFLILLLLWIFLSAIISFPYYLPYYNELAGGTANGYKIATDSNYDWGQDLKRLADFVEERKINKIAIDYFGGGNPAYYFGKKFEPWQSSKGKPEKWFAVSLTFLQGAHAKPVKNFTQEFENTYSWLKNKTTTARAGASIFIYKF